MMIIAISGKRRSGKSTLANILRANYQFHPVSLATPLKQFCMEQFGLSADQVDGHLKEVVDTRYARTPRQILIDVGQFFRSYDKDWWINKLWNQIAALSEIQDKFVIPDMRFKNELDFFKSKGALLVRLERSEELTGQYIEDPSETELDQYKQWDVHIPANENVQLADLYMVTHRIHDLLSPTQIG